MEIALDQKELLKSTFREVIKEVLQEEKINFYNSIFPNANINETKEIESLYGNPNTYNKADFVDKTNWVLNES